MHREHKNFGMWNCLPDLTYYLDSIQFGHADVENGDFPSEAGTDVQSSVAPSCTHPPKTGRDKATHKENYQKQGRWRKPQDLWSCWISLRLARSPHLESQMPYTGYRGSTTCQKLRLKRRGNATN